MKTNVENSEKFSDVLNFNYKFIGITSEEGFLSYDNIRIQTDIFEDVKIFGMTIFDLFD